jgi:hypothetical protein
MHGHMHGHMRGQNFGKTLISGPHHGPSCLTFLHLLGMQSAFLSRCSGGPKHVSACQLFNSEHNDIICTNLRTSSINLDAHVW